MVEWMAFGLQFNIMTKIDSRPKSWNFIRNRSVRKGISSEAVGAQIYIDSANFNKSQKKIVLLQMFCLVHYLQFIP